jgi:carboxyl-terminal processing protease
LNRRNFVLGVAFVTLFGLGWWVGRGGARGDVYSSIDLFVEVLHKVEDNYVDPVDGRKLVDGALRGMLKGLDPYSQFLDTRAYGQLQSVTHGSFGGIGIVVGVRDNYPTVISPIESTPAWRAGIRSGDVIVSIEGKSSLGLNIEEVADRLRGPQGTPVRISVHREGEEQDQDYTLEREIIVTRSVPYSFVAERGIGYMRLANFSEKSGAEVRAAVESLRAAGVQRLILDLRQNPGGLLDQAVSVAEQFVPRNALLVYTHGRSRAQDTRYHARETRPQLQWPLVVLVDGGSASAAEIVAGALQDLDRALLIGRTTFGKGSVQSVFPLRDRGAALKLTTALYHTPSGRSIHRAAHDTLPGDEDGPGDGVVAPPDTTSPVRPVFHTAAGRVVYGGGGITPDLTVLPDSFPALYQKAEGRSLPFRFASRWFNTRKGSSGAAEPGSPPWDDFVAFLRAEKFAFDDAELAAQRTLFERALRREVARRVSGDATAARVAFEGDPVFRRALEVLRRARNAREVFALGPPGDAARPARATVPAPSGAAKR